MKLVEGVVSLSEQMRAWRHDFHRHPETAFEEVRTAKVIAGLLSDFGLKVETGIAKTGVVATLSTGNGPSVALRADMDALNMSEQTGAAYCSSHDGKMHACGHDGHSAMLLGAAKYLSVHKNFNGTVHFIFQPAEENEGGGRLMVEEGLFERFPADAVYGLHNWPKLPLGQVGVKAGPIMASCDRFELTIVGKGGHGAMPNQCVDPIVVAAQVVSTLQTIPSRMVHPCEPVVVSVTQIAAGDTWNVIPATAVLRGTTRSFDSEIQALIEPMIKRIADGVCAANGARAELSYVKGYPATVNHAAETEKAAAVAASLVGESNIKRDLLPSMGAEDFSYMLEKRPGAYIWLGTARTQADNPTLHHPAYDFNDDALALGASYWVKLVEAELQ